MDQDKKIYNFWWFYMQILFVGKPNCDDVLYESESYVMIIQKNIFNIVS